MTVDMNINGESWGQTYKLLYISIIRYRRLIYVGKIHWQDKFTDIS